ncbi:hypothetical protein ABK040_001636 [Willaertia magna]
MKYLLSLTFLFVFFYFQFLSGTASSFNNKPRKLSKEQITNWIGNNKEFNIYSNKQFNPTLIPSQNDPIPLNPDEENICVNGTTNFVQDICQQETSENRTIQIFPTYCKYKNSYFVPNTFSDHDFELFTEVPECIDPKTGKISNDPLTSECSIVRAITTVELGPFMLNDNTNETTNLRFSLFGMNSGNVYAINFNTNQLIPLRKYGFKESSVVFLTTAVVNSNMAYVISTDKENDVHFYLTDFGGEGFVFCNDSKKIEENEVIQSLQTITINNEVYAVVLVHLSDLEKEIRFSKLENNCNIHLNTFRYKIKLDRKSDIFSVKAFTQRVNITNPNYGSLYINDAPGSLTRLLFVLQSDYSVNFINFVPKEMEFNLSSFALNDYTMFISNSTNEVITESTAIGEEVRRIDLSNKDICSFTSNITIAPAQEIILLVALHNKLTKKSRIVVKNLPEFYSFTLSPSNEELLSPIPTKRKLQCDVQNGYYNVDETCIKAIEHEITVDSAVTTMMARFIDMPFAVKEYLNLKQNTSNQELINTLCFIRAGGNSREGLNQEEFIRCVNELSHLQNEAENLCQVDLMNSLGRDYFKGMTNDALLHNVFISLESNEVLIYGIQPTLCNPNSKEIIIRPFNSFQLIGKPIDMTISDNGQHLFATITRKKWEIDSINRYKEICDILEKDPYNTFLKDFLISCNNNPPRSVNINTFGYYVSNCIPGTYCPSLTDNVVEAVPDKFYTIRPNVLSPCPKGSYCILGTRQSCPIGFVCDEEMMSSPKPCKDNRYNCYEYGLSAPKAPSKGTISLTPYFPVLPVSQGYYIERQSDIDLNIKKCQLGDYCVLGRAVDTPNFGNETVDDLKCPANTYCSSESDIVPVICSSNFTHASYCPKGSSILNLCPAGYYCPAPDTKKPCRRSQYCPDGTLSPNTCPAGYYCATPATKVICPAGSYCPEGSVRPHPCGWLAICEEGKGTITFNILGFVFVFVCLIAVVLVYRLIEYTRKKWNMKVDVRQKEEKEKALLEIRQNSLSPNENHISEKEMENIYIDMTMGKSFNSSNVSVNIGFKDLSLELHQGHKRILEGVTGEIRHSELTAVMGPSGSGKTTFLTTLAGKAYYGKRGGQVYLNGKEDDLTNFKKLTAFVPQNDIMLPMMTIKETIHFAAKTRLDKRKEIQEVRDLINGILSILGLDEIKHSIIGDEKKRGISGGQKKRVNIGIELASAPSVLFLDEPTSGLDSSASKEVIQALRTIAVQQHITIVTVIHQPRYEIFTMFHKVLLLGKGGRVVYLGQAKKAVDYFEMIGFKCPQHVNPADFIMDCIAGDIPRENDIHFKPEDLFTLWEQYQEKLHQLEEIPKGIDKNEQETVLLEEDNHHIVISNINENNNSSQVADCTYESLIKENKCRKVSFWTQLKLCLRRNLIQLSRDTYGFILDVILVYIAGLTLGVIFNGSRFIGPPAQEIIDQCVGVLKSKCELPIDDPIINMATLLVLGMGLCGSMSSLSVFGDERVNFVREYESNLSTLAYFLAKNITQLPIIFISPAILISIFYILSNPLGQVYNYYLVLLLVNFTSYGIGYLLSIIFPPSISKLAAVVIVVVNNLLAGSRPTIPQMNEMFFPMPYIYWLSYLRYAQEALYLAELSAYKQIYSLDSSLNLYGYSFSDWVWCLLAIPLFGLLFRLLAYISLLFSPPEILSKIHTFLAFVLDYKEHYNKIKKLIHRKGKDSVILRVEEESMDEHEFHIYK